VRPLRTAAWTRNLRIRCAAIIQPLCVATGLDRIFPTIVGELRHQRPDWPIGIFHDWDGFGRLVERGAATVVEDVRDSTHAVAIAEQAERDGFARCSIRSPPSSAAASSGRRT